MGRAFKIGSTKIHQCLDRMGSEVEKQWYNDCYEYKIGQFANSEIIWRGPVKTLSAAKIILAKSKQWMERLTTTPVSDLFWSYFFLSIHPGLVFYWSKQSEIRSGLLSQNVSKFVSTYFVFCQSGIGFLFMSQRSIPQTKVPRYMPQVSSKQG